MEGILVFACLISLSFGHLCLFAPPQRGPMMDMNKPGASNCAHTTGPCGGVPPAHDAVVYPKNENITVTFMKNLDHFNKTGPGKFVISLLTPQGGGNPTVLGTIPDNNEPSLSIYTTKVAPPTEPAGEGPYILQVVYQPNNSSAPAAFYQCADVGFGPK